MICFFISKIFSEPFVSIDELLRKMPRYNMGQTAADFEFRWRHWQTEVIARIDEGFIFHKYFWYKLRFFTFTKKNNFYFLWFIGEFATSQQLGMIAKVLAGDDSTFKEEVYVYNVSKCHRCLFRIPFYLKI